MKSRLWVIIVFALIPFIFLNVDASVDTSCEKNVGSADESCTPAELLEICDTLWSPRYDGSQTPGNIFCNVVYDLDLKEDDVRKLGINLDWENYTIQSSKDFVDDWGFYQDEVIPDTLLIYPSISIRDSLPPAMKVQISFDYNDETEIKTFDESFKIYMKYDPDMILLPTDTWIIMPDKNEFAFYAYEQLNYRLTTDSEFAQLLQTEVVGFGVDESNEGIFIVVDPMYANLENFDKYEEIFRVTIGEDAPIKFEVNERAESIDKEDPDFFIFLVIIFILVCSTAIIYFWRKRK